jgi:hypothetical protein
VDLQSTLLMSSDSDALLGSTEPRIWTPPLRELTSETSYGFDVIDFARDVLGMPLDPWEEWLVIHGGELLEDGRPRFRTVLCIVARQNGKTFLLKVLTLYWMFVEQQKMILSTSTNRDYAKESWKHVVEIAQGNEFLNSELKITRRSTRGVTAAIGEETLSTTAGCRYKIAASNRSTGRSLSIDRLILDEIREQRNFDAWNASTKATNARAFAQIWAISNQGDEQSVVLDSLRKPGVTFIQTGQGDPRLGLFEWSAPPGAEVDDPRAIAAANPNLGYRIDIDSIIGEAKRAKMAGGAELIGFRTEVLCQKVSLLDPAIEPAHWSGCRDQDPQDLAQHRDRLALCIDVSTNLGHATLMAAVVIDGLVHAEVVKVWDNTHEMRRDLPGIVAKVRPRVVGWFPQGPAAAISAQMQEKRGSVPWPPRGVQVEPIRGEVSAVCMALAEIAKARELRHPDDALLNAQVQAAQKGKRGDTWVFVRDGNVPIDAVYALAGAVQLARTLPAPRAPMVILGAADSQETHE